MSKIEQANFKAIEAELYGYHDTKRELELLEEEILEGSPFQEVAVQCGNGDTTASKAVRLLSSKELVEVRRRLSAIDKAVEVLKVDDKQEKYKLLQMKYFDRKYSDIGIQQELHISERTFRYWRRDIIKLVGSYLGWRI